MQTQQIYEIIDLVHSEPESCFEFWLLSNAGIIPGKEAAQKTGASSEPLTVTTF